MLCAGLTYSSIALAQDPANAIEHLGASIRTIAQKVSPAVVQIVAQGYGSPDDDQKQNSGDKFTRERSGGSGIVVDSSGYIMTNAHVIDKTTSIRALVGAVSDGTRAGTLNSPAARRFGARVVGVDRDSDLALLKIEAVGLPTIDFADSDQIAQGDIVLAIGSPLLLRNSLSVGVVSATARGRTDDDPMLYIQTDASLNPGASGGALINSAGRMVGMNTSILSSTGGTEGIGFAIPANLVESVYRQLRSDGTVLRGWIGMTAQNITPVLAKAMSLRVQYGVLVADVEPHSPADNGGLRTKDILLRLDGRKINTTRQFQELVSGRKPGDRLALEIERAEDKLTVSVHVEGEHSAHEANLAGRIGDNLIARLGIFCLPIDAQTLETMPQLRYRYGVVVAGHASQTQSEFLDLKSGDVIHEVNDMPISSVEVLRQSIDRLGRGEPVALQIERGGRLRYVSFEME